MFIVYGGRDYPDLVIPGAEKITEFLKSHAPGWLNWQSQRLDMDGHVPVPSLNNGLLYIFPDYMVSEEIKSRGIKAVEHHYHRLTANYGFSIPIPEEVIFDMAMQKKNEKEYDEAISLFDRLLQHYPGSIRTVFFIGDTHLEMGNKTKALENYKKVLTLDGPQRFKEAAERRITDLEKNAT